MTTLNVTIPNVLYGEITLRYGADYSELGLSPAAGAFIDRAAEATGKRTRNTIVWHVEATQQELDAICAEVLDELIERYETEPAFCDARERYEFRRLAVAATKFINEYSTKGTN